MGGVFELGVVLSIRFHTSPPHSLPTLLLVPAMEETLDHVRIVRTDDGLLTCVSALEAHPDLAAKISIFIAYAAQAELCTRDLLAKVLRISQEAAQEILSPIQSQGLRLDLLARIASTSASPMTAELPSTLTEMKWVASERNKYAHAQYGIPQDGTFNLYRIAFFTDGRRKPLWDLIDHSRLDAEITRSKALVVLLWETLR